MLPLLTQKIYSIKFSSIVFLLSVIIIAGFPYLSHASKCAVPEGLTLTPPDATGTPTKVFVGIYLIDVKKINDVDQTFTGDIFSTLSWQDSRLSSKELGRSLEGCSVRLQDIWSPQVNIVNQWNVKTSNKSIVSIDKAGNVIFQQRVTGDFSSPFNLKDFPFDTQLLNLSVASFKYGPENVNFVLDEKRTGMVDKLSVAGWSIEPGKTQIASEYIKPQDRNLSRLNHQLIAKRHMGYYLWKVILPLSLIVFMAGTVFWIDPSDAGPQIGISTASVLTLIAFQFSLGNLLPKVSYLTRGDKFMFGATLLVFLALAEAIMTSRLAKKGNQKLAMLVDRWAQFGYIVLFLTFSAVSFFV